VETSGFQPVQPDQPGAFVPGPAPVPEDEQAVIDGGWSYTYEAPAAAGQPLASEGVPLAAPLEPAPFAPPQEAAPFAPPQEAAPFAPPTEATSAFTLEPAAPFAPPVAAQLPVGSLEPLQASYEPAAPVQPDYSQPATAYVPEQASPGLVADAAPLVAPPWEQPQAAVNQPAVADPTVLVAESEADESAYLRGSTETALEEDDINLNDLLMHVLDTGASDLHLTSGARPAIRLNGALRQMENQPVLTPPLIQRVLYAAMTQKQREKFEEVLELDFSYSVPGRARFRVNVYRQRDALGAAFRIIPFEIKKLEDLGVPPSVARFAQLPRGFVLVTGPTGSGKSTTLASLVDLANRTRDEHIMTVEDPIEFLHRHQRCIINQREVGEDTLSFGNALKHVLRQDPDIILVGEMRDLETISVALTAAETGHLVFATLHTSDAAQTIDRVIDVFPPHQQQQVRIQLAGSLQGVVCQTLAQTADGRGRAVATEVLVATPAVRNLIREGKTHQIYSAMQAGAKHGMHTMDQHLADLVKSGRITYEVGMEKCHHIEDFNRLTGKA
jgi:twitching motility protein PilT